MTDVCPQCGALCRKYYGPAHRLVQRWRQGYRCTECAWGIAVEYDELVSVVTELGAIAVVTEADIQAEEDSSGGVN